MGFSGFIKKHKLIVALISIPVILFLLCLTVIMVINIYFSCMRVEDISHTEAMQIAQKKFGCDEILWIEAVGDIHVFIRPEDRDVLKNIRSHYYFYVIGEKDGKEVYCIIPSTPETDEPFLTSWNFDYPFTEIVEKFKEYGADYSLYGHDFSNHNSFIEIYEITEKNYHLSKYPGDKLTYEQLDVKAFFYYKWYDDEYLHYCEIVQANGELRVFKNAWKK